MNYLIHKIQIICFIKQKFVSIKSVFKQNYVTKIIQKQVNKNIYTKTSI